VDWKPISGCIGRRSRRHTDDGTAPDPIALADSEHMARTPPRARPPKSVMAILHEMENASDRSAAIVAGAFLENYLALAIMSRMRSFSDSDNDDRRVKKQVFENTGPLTTFAAKISVGYALDLYGKRPREDLHLIRDVRNHFAHTMEPCEFSDPDVRQFCDKFQEPEWLAQMTAKIAPTLPRMRFMATVAHLATGLSHESKSEKHRPPSPQFVTY
jgi:DNA-binding MltR family transcriptional regulator